MKEMGETVPDSIIDITETQVSWLQLTSVRVDKIRKPVTFSFIDLHDSTAINLGVGAVTNRDEQLSGCGHAPIAGGQKPDLLARADNEFPSCLDGIARSEVIEGDSVRR